MLLIDILAEKLFGHLVSLLKFPVVNWLALHCIIGEVHQSVFGLNIKHFTASSDIDLLIKVHSELIIEESHKHKTSNIKFPAKIK